MHTLKSTEKKRLKVLLISTYDVSGGAAIACHRLAESLHNNKDIEIKMLVGEKSGNSPLVESLGKSFFHRLRRLILFAIDPFLFTIFAKFRKQFSCSYSRLGNKDIINHPWVKEADVIHLHWINHNFISLETIGQLQELGKPVVWTLHDMWAFTGICHYSGDCEGYIKACGNCHFLKHPHQNDLSADNWKQKQRVYKNLHFISTSNWLGQLASQSPLLKKFPLTVIPAPVDSRLFKPVASKRVAKKQMNLNPDKVYILFSAQFIYQERKGLTYLIKALTILKDQNPAIADTIELLLFGEKFNPDSVKGIPYTYLGELKEPEKVAQAYNCSDVFVLPSLEDNLPNAVLESLACGIPVVGFNTGGIPEMIEHMGNGYLAEYKSPEDLLKGILWVISDTERYRLLSWNARKEILENFNYESISAKHADLYQELVYRNTIRKSPLHIRPRSIHPEKSTGNKLLSLEDRFPTYHSLRENRKLKRKRK